PPLLRRQGDHLSRVRVPHQRHRRALRARPRRPRRDLGLQGRQRAGLVRRLDRRADRPREERHQLLHRHHHPGVLARHDVRFLKRRPTRRVVKTTLMGTIASMLSVGAGEAVAVSAPERKPLTYGGLRDLAAKTVESLNAMGIGRGDRVAMVLGNGPEMAAAFVSIASGAATAPLNPGYRHDEFEFYLGDLRPKALVIDAGVASPSREVAAQLSIPIVELHADKDSAAGSFHLETSLRGKPASGGAAGADDVALLLHTSGTTSRPKLVPLLQRNLV